MPEKTEEIVENHEDTQASVHESHQKTSNKYKKIFKLFRSMRKENTSNKLFEKEVEKNGKKVKKKKWDAEERKEIFKKNMENSWVELPNTLQRKKEKISEEILSEFHDPDSSDSDALSVSKKSKEKEIFKTNRSYAPNEGNDDGEPTCEYFRKKGEDEIDAESVKSKETELTKQEKFINYKKKKNFHSEIICQKETVNDGGQVSLEKIRKLAEGDYERRCGGDDEDDNNADDETSSNNNKKGNSYDSKAAVEEINLLFHDLIAENSSKNLSEVTDSSTAFEESDYDISDPYVSLVGNDVQHKRTRSQVDKIDNLRPEYREERKEIKMSFTRSESSDSLLNGSSPSVSSSSDLSQRDVSNEKMNKEVTSDFHSENESNCYEQNVEVTYVNEINEARPNLKSLEATGLTNESSDNQSKTESQVFFKRNVKETTQYSDIIFSLPANTQGIFVNEYFNEDSSTESSNQEKPKTSDSKDRIIIYQELDFVKSPRDDKKSNEETEKDESFQSTNKKTTNEDKDKVEEMKESRNSINSTVKSSLSEEQKAKKKSAEAIAKELSSQILSKRSQENLESKKNFTNIISISVNGDFKTESTTTAATADSSENRETPVNGMDSSKPEIEGTKKVIETEDGSKVISRNPECNGSSETWDKKGLMVSELPYFSVADWRKAVVMGTKRGMNLSAMETIVEEPESDTSTKLSVREILRRFEELGNKHFSENSCMTDDERTATLKQIYETLKCLEEKVKNFENWDELSQKQQQYTESPRIKDHSSGAWTGRGVPQKLPHSTPVRGNHHENEEEVSQTSINDGKHSLLQFAIHHFRQSPEKFEMLKTSDGSISGSLKVIESKNKKNKGKSVGKDSSEWTWKEQVDLVKFTAKPIEQSLLQLDTPELSDLAVECFICLMRYMGDLPMPTDVSEVKCVYTILMHCHKFEQLRDEVYCQLMKQTTNNKSIQQESCQRGWRLFSIVAAYFVSSDTLKPFLFKYLETAAYDKRRAYHGTAMVCLQNLRKTFKYGGRKNVPSVEEITAISAGRNSKRQIYRLPGGTEKVVNTRSTTVVQDVIEELCVMINVTNPQEMEEFSVYCIVEGDTFTMPLAREEYILDVTTELHKNHQVFYLIFCRSVWYFPLRLDSQLYVEVVFNQIAPDYLEGLLLIMPGESLEQEVIYDISKIAALLHRAADMTHVPSMKETKFLLPKPALSVRDVKPSQWVNMVQSNWQDCENLTTIQAKAQVLDVLSKWPLFGSSFFAVKKASEPKERTDNILALNRNGVHFIDLITHETLLHYPFSEVISTRKVKSEDGTLFLDMKCGNLMQQRITRLQTDQAHEISRLIRQYITMQQRMGANMA